jgi:serine/threonine protein kinase
VVKQFSAPLSDLTPKEQKDAIDEVRLLAQVRSLCATVLAAAWLSHTLSAVSWLQMDHSNIVRYYDHFLHDDVLNIVMEYADAGSLASRWAACSPRRSHRLRCDVACQPLLFVVQGICRRLLHGQRVGVVCAAAAGAAVPPRKQDPASRPKAWQRAAEGCVAASSVSLQRRRCCVYAW